MTKFLACFALFCLIGTAFSAVGTACVTNSLLNVYDFDQEDEEISGSALKYCKSLQAGTSCCAATIVDTFQTKIEAIAETLTESVIKRDTAIVTLRDTTIPALATKLASLETNAAAALVVIKAAIAADVEDESTVEPYTLAQAQTLAENLEALAEDAADNLKDATEGFTDFQKARSSCVVELLGLQAAAWCLACTPDANDQGVGAAGIVTIADDTCTRLTGACYDYLTTSVTQSSILSVGWVSEIIDELNAALEDVADSTAETQEAALQALSDAVEPAETESLDTEALPVELPESCTSEDDCDWICETLFMEGEINYDALLAGGNPTTPLVETTEVAVVVDPGNRRLAGTWEPAADEAGVTIDWQDDPAELNSDDDTVTPAGAGIIKSGFVCVVALLSVFFF